MANANAVKAGDAYIQVSVDGLADIKAEMTNIRSEIAAGFDKSTKLQAVSALADGFRMIGGAISFATARFKWFSANVNEAVERVSELQKIADRLGTSLTFISRIKIAAITSNMSMNELEQSFAAFQRNMETFSQGVGESKATFEGLGITPEMLKGWGTLENQMLNIITRLGQIEDPSRRAGAAMRIFGEQGRKLIPLVNANATAFKALMAQSDFLGLTLDEKAGRALDRTRDNIRLLLEQVNGLWNQIAAKLGPELVELTNELIVAVKTVFDLVFGGDELNNVIATMTKMIQPLAKGFMNLYIMMMRVQSAFLSLVEMKNQFDPIQGFWSRVLGQNDEDRQAFANMVSELRQSTDNSISNALAGVEQMDATFDKNREAWKELVAAAEPVTRELKIGAEEFKESAQDIKEAFKMFTGEVLGNTAEDAKRIKELEQKLWTDMRTHLRNIDSNLRQSPVLRAI